MVILIGNQISYLSLTKCNIERVSKSIDFASLEGLIYFYKGFLLIKHWVVI